MTVAADVVLVVIAVVVVVVIVFVSVVVVVVDVVFSTSLRSQSMSTLSDLQFGKKFIICVGPVKKEFFALSRVNLKF